MLSPPDLYVLQLKCDLKAQKFSSTEEVIAKAMSAPTGILETFQEHSSIPGMLPKAL
jgi:hypothetical protein